MDLPHLVSQHFFIVYRGEKKATVVITNLELGKFTIITSVLWGPLFISSIKFK